MRAIEDVKNKFLSNIDCLMELIENKGLMEISENEIQRQLGVCFYFWEELTRKQRGDEDE